MDRPDMQRAAGALSPSPSMATTMTARTTAEKTEAEGDQETKELEESTTGSGVADEEEV